MGEVSDIESLLQRHKDEELRLERMVKRAGWGKALVAAGFSAALSIAGMSWQARGMLDELRQDLALQKQDLRYLREHIDNIGNVAIEAKGKAETAINMQYAAKGGYPTGFKP